jgi:hypothetical protein
MARWDRNWQGAVQGHSGRRLRRSPRRGGPTQGGKAVLSGGRSAPLNRTVGRDPLASRPAGIGCLAPVAGEPAPAGSSTRQQATARQVIERSSTGVRLNAPQPKQCSRRLARDGPGFLSCLVRRVLWRSWRTCCMGTHRGPLQAAAQSLRPFAFHRLNLPTSRTGI